jgi:hypothetical protein
MAAVSWADECGNCNRGRICRVGIETRVRLETNRPAFLDLEIKRQLVSVIKIAEGKIAARGEDAYFPIWRAVRADPCLARGGDIRSRPDDG